MKKKIIIIFITLFSLIPSAFATTIYNNESEFITQINSDYYLEDFSGYVYGDPLDGNIKDAYFGPVKGYTWHANADKGLWSNEGALSIYNFEDYLAITFTGLPVMALGGIFTSTDSDGYQISHDINIALNDGTSVIINGSAFIGFTSEIPVISLTLTGINDPDFYGNWPQLDHFYVGTTPVPEPATMLLLGSGIIYLAGFRRRINKR